MTGLRNLLWLLPLIFILSWPGWGKSVIRFLAPPGIDSQVAGQVKNKRAPAESFNMDHVFFTQLTDGRRDWQIKADRLYSAPDPAKMQMESIAAEVFEGSLRKFHITSRDGVYDNKKKILELEKNVRVEAADGYVVQSARLRYDDRARKITTRSAVHITADDMDLRGQGFVYDIKSGSYEVGGRVKVQSW